MNQAKQPKITSLRFEFLAVFILLPTILGVIGIGRAVFPLLWFATFCALFMLKRVMKNYEFKLDWNWSSVNRENLQPILIRFFFVALLLSAFTFFHDPDRLFGFILSKPLFWAVVMVLYPILSVVPQELVYRSFIFRRYGEIVSSHGMLLINAVSFGCAHMVLRNWIAVLFSTVGGYLFAQTYQRHRSLALVSIEHSLYGCFIFTIGLGWYFYDGRFH